MMRMFVAARRRAAGPTTAERGGREVVIVRRLAAALEALITRFSRDGRRVFFDPAEFAWVETLEAGFPAIRRELEAVLLCREQIPNLQDVSRWRLTEGGQWKSFFFYAYGRRVPENCARCPQTEQLLRQIPGMKTAMFSILAPKTHIPEHRGPYKGVLRYHLGLIVPRPEAQCRIRVGAETRSWAEGKSLIFDDSHLHEVWNDADALRVVLFVDFLRPLPVPLAVLNRLMAWRLSRMPFVTLMVDGAREAARRAT